MKLKVCGMKYKDNITEVAQMQPDYLGFIFYEKSNRFFDGDSPVLPKHIKKVGVFVDASVAIILDKITSHNLQAVQLHGSESPEFCRTLKRQSKEFQSDECQSERSRRPNDDLITAAKSRLPSLNSIDRDIEIIKVFSIKDTFDFSVLKPYENVCDYFLFDTKGKLPGGNGYTFNWEVLKDYPSTKPFILSGGIGFNELKKLKVFKSTKASKYCHAIDVNSQFEIEAGLKNIELLKEFKRELSFRT